MNVSNYSAEALYHQIMSKDLDVNRMRFCNLGEDMHTLDEVIGEFWKHRFLIDNRAKRAYEFMSHSCILQTITADDIDWDKLKDIPEETIQVARHLNAIYPTNILLFRDNVGLVKWQLNPDGEYYMDEDGFGMTNDMEFSLYGCIDRTGHVRVKFRPIWE
jgi:hypothetical protein